MTDKWATAFEAAGPMAFYDEVMRPAIFDPVARVVLEGLALRPGERLLDVATGPGSVALPAAELLGPAGRVTGCDISAAMLALAEANEPGPDSAPVTWVETPACPLEGVADESHDVATCQQGLQFFPDRVGALREMRRALVPGGRLAIAVWSAIDDSPLFDALGEVVRDVFGDAPRDRYASGPWGLPDPGALAAVVSEAGFRDVRVERRTIDAVFPEGLAVMLPMLNLSPVGDDTGEADEDQRRRIDEALERRLESMVGDDGAVRSPLVTNVAFAVR